MEAVMPDIHPARTEQTDADHVTTLLNRVQHGVDDAHNELFDCIYTELHRMANAAWRWVPASDTLQPTALVHEMYARLFHLRDISWENRRHFFATASRAMHDILVEQARRHCALKRGGHMRRTPLNEADIDKVQNQACEILALNEALDRLSTLYPDRTRIVMLKIFGGLTYEQIADLEGCSAITARRGWAFAKTWLKEYMNAEKN